MHFKPQLELLHILGCTEQRVRFDEETSQKDKVDTLGIEPRASRMLSGCDTTTPCAHLLALADTDTMHLPTADHGHFIAKPLQRSRGGAARTGQDETWCCDCRAIWKNGHTGI